MVGWAEKATPSCTRAAARGPRPPSASTGPRPTGGAAGRSARERRSGSPSTPGPPRRRRSPPQPEVGLSKTPAKLRLPRVLPQGRAAGPPRHRPPHLSDELAVCRLDLGGDRRLDRAGQIVRMEVPGQRRDPSGAGVPSRRPSAAARTSVSPAAPSCSAQAEAVTANPLAPRRRPHSAPPGGRAWAPTRAVASCGRGRPARAPGSSGRLRRAGQPPHGPLVAVDLDEVPVAQHGRGDGAGRDRRHAILATDDRGMGQRATPSQTHAAIVAKAGVQFGDVDSQTRTSPGCRRWRWSASVRTRTLPRRPATDRHPGEGLHLLGSPPERAASR